MGFHKELQLATREFLITVLWVFVSLDSNVSATTCLASCGRHATQMAQCPPPTLNIQVSLATGFAAGVASALTFQGKASDGGNVGGHFNPTVTLALAIRGALPRGRAVAFMLAQILASLLAALMVLSISGRECLDDNFHMMEEAMMAPGGSRLFLQIILSVVIVFVPLWAHERQGLMAVPVLVGFSYIAVSLTGLPQLMDVPNLLRCFGLLLIGVRNWSMVWPALLSTLIAAPLSVAVDTLLFSTFKFKPEDGNETDTDADEAL